MPQDEPRASTTAVPPPPSAEILYYQNSSMLDTIFINKSKKKPAWITITAGPQTTLYSVSPSGKLNPAAIIEWAGKAKGSKKSEVTVQVDGETFPADRFGRPSGGFYGGTSARHFTIEGVNVRWSCTSLSSSPSSTALALRVSVILQWDCTAEIPVTPSSSTQPTSPTSRFLTFFKSFSPGKQRVLLASYLEGSSKRQSQGLTIYPEGVPYTASLLLSAIFANARGEGTWKRQQSKASAEEIEAILSADLGGELPTYTPVRDTRSARTDLHPSVATHTPSRWTHQRSRTSIPVTPLDDYPPEYASMC